ncbi:hypothetical protein TNCV_2624381 [Trichonephila clavipes]|nr:hypothetical protein TNCV_2624381 [Trichonephila clavipes]
MLGVEDCRKQMRNNFYSETDNETPIKTVTFSNSLHCLGTAKIYLMQQEVKNAIFFTQHNVEKELCRGRNQKDCQALEGRESVKDDDRSVRTQTSHTTENIGKFSAVVPTRGLLVMDHVILNHGQVTWMTSELAPPLLTTTPHQREDFQLSTDLACIAAQHGGALVVLGSNS